MTLRLLAVGAITAALMLASSWFFGPGDADWDGAWQLTSGTYDGTGLELTERRPITLVLDGDDAAGTAACNDYGALVLHTDGGISFDSRGTTAMLCSTPS